MAHRRQAKALEQADSSQPPVTRNLELSYTIKSSVNEIERRMEIWKQLLVWLILKTKRLRCSFSIIHHHSLHRPITHETLLHTTYTVKEWHKRGQTLKNSDGDIGHARGKESTVSEHVLD